MKDDCLEFKFLMALFIYYQLFRSLDFKESSSLLGGKSELSVKFKPPYAFKNTVSRLLGGLGVQD